MFSTMYLVNRDYQKAFVARVPSLSVLVLVSTTSGTPPPCTMQRTAAIYDLFTDVSHTDERRVNGKETSKSTFAGSRQEINNTDILLSLIHI